VLFYDQASQAGTVCRVTNPGKLSVVHSYPDAAGGYFGSWSHLAYARAAAGEEKLLFYDRERHDGLVGRFDAAGRFVQQWPTAPGTETGFGPWTHITSLNDGGLFFYEATDGTAALGRVGGDGSFSTESTHDGLGAGWDEVVAAGNRNVFLYRSDGAGALWSPADGFAQLKSWGPGPSVFPTGCQVVGAANGLVLFYEPMSGRGRTGGFSQEDFVALRDYPDGAFALGWTHIAPLGALR
jgi:hypothetical protein